MDRGVQRVMFSSDRDDWATPRPLFVRLAVEFGIGLDAAAHADNKRIDRYLSPADDALRVSWRELCRREQIAAVWLNPPYSRRIDRWTDKAIREAAADLPVVVLVPARTDTAWFGRLADAATEIRFVRGRVRFEGAPAGAPFPSAIVVLRGGRDDRPLRVSWIMPDGLPCEVAL